MIPPAAAVVGEEGGVGGCRQAMLKFSRDI